MCYSVRRREKYTFGVLRMNMGMKKICQKIAAKHKTTPEDVYRNIQEAIEQAYAAPQDESVRKFQAEVPRRGTIPTPEEMLAFVSAYIKDPPAKT